VLLRNDGNDRGPHCRRVVAWPPICSGRVSAVASNYGVPATAGSDDSALAT
jgi:hypothetical protein